MANITGGAGTITAADVASATSAGGAGQTLITGTPTAKSFVLDNLTGAESGFYALITGNASANTLAFEFSEDGGATWVQFAAAEVAIAGTATTLNSTTTNGVFVGVAAGLTQVRVRCTAYVGGTVSVSFQHGVGAAAGATGAVLAAILIDTNDIETSVGNIPPLGQAVKASSTPVTMASDQPAIPTSPGAPPTASIVAGANNGTATQTITDITGATGIAATKVFQGNVAISASAAQVAAANAAGSLVVTVTWVPGTGGTTTQRVATVNLNFPAGGATGTGLWDSKTIVVPVQLYVGTAGTGKFQATVTTTGTITALAWDVIVNGTAQ